MSGTLTVQQATRRYVGLTALRWLPVGISIPVTVLLALSRGLTLGQVGAVFLVHSAVVVLLELPTGGLADAIGRRPVLVASGLLHVASCAAYATAESVAGFVLATALLGTGRALDSGPLQAWYVDAVHLADPDADVVPGLSRAGVADCLALSVGAVLGGLTPALLDGSSTSLLVLPHVAAGALSLVSVVAVLLLVTPTGPPRTGSALRAVTDGVAAVPRTVRDALSLAAGDDALRRVLVLSLVCGVCLSTLELLGPGLFAELSGSRTSGSAVFGAVMAVSFLAGAAGSALAPRSRRLARGSMPCAVAGLTAVSALSLVGVAGSRTVLLAVCAYAGFYLANAASWPLLHAVLHSRVGSGGRATALSASSLALMLGGGLANVVNPRVVDAGGRGAAFLVAGTAALVAAAVAARLRDEEALLDEPLDDGQDLLGGVVLGDAGRQGQHAEQLAEPAGAVAAGEQGRAVRVDPA
ncbi:MAG: transporter [Frankiales bacterium]|nr:transporter [Frankiales bacterium]